MEGVDILDIHFAGAVAGSQRVEEGGRTAETEEEADTRAFRSVEAELVGLGSPTTARRVLRHMPLGSQHDGSVLFKKPLSSSRTRLDRRMARVPHQARRPEGSFSCLISCLFSIFWHDLY